MSGEVHSQNSDFKSSKDNLPLCVDLDGTLVHTDVLQESVLVLLKQNIFYLLLFPAWLFKGKAYFKQMIADRVDLDISLLPYNEEFLDFLKDQNKQRRVLILVTATNVKYAKQIAAHLGIFENVFASDSVTNLSGKYKRKLLADIFGKGGFDYAGNAKIDLEVWTFAKNAILVNPEAGARRRAEREIGACMIFENREPRLQYYFRAIRPHQWIKNILLYVPLILAHRINEPNLFFSETLAFLAFGLCASSVYILNDLRDFCLFLFCFAA